MEKLTRSVENQDTCAVFGAPPGGANPGGLTSADLGKKVANFNIILHPNSWDQSGTTCQNNGSRIFYSADVTPWLLYWFFNSTTNVFNSTTNGFVIADCNGTQDGDASVYQNNGAQVRSSSAWSARTTTTTRFCSLANSS